MGECIEDGLFVELVGRSVDDNCSVQIIIQIGRPSDGVEGKVPVNPPAHPMVDNLPQKRIDFYFMTD